MNRGEQLQKLAQLIRKEHDAQGDTITLFSRQIEQITSITLDEQVDALNILRDDYKCVEYTATQDYKNESELTPQDLGAIAEIAMLGGYSEDFVRQTTLSGVTYKIEIFDSIEDAVSIAGGLLCELTVENGVTPVVTIRGAKYRLQSLQAGSIPQRVIEHASNGHYGTHLGSTDFKSLGIAQLQTANYNVIQKFRNNIFGQDGALGDFTAITPKTFLLKSRTILTEEKISAIKKLARN
jgi:hypothetical protein